MKKTIQAVRYFFMLAILALVNMTALYAQDGSGTNGGSASHSSSSTTTTSSSTAPAVPADWYMQPWVWVVGGIVLILLLVALSRGSKSTSVHRTTVIRERDA